MTKIKSLSAKKIWPTERRLINKIITKQKGYHNKPYPRKDKIPSGALHSVKGALMLLDKAEKKKPNKRHILKYRRTYEHKNPLPEAHYFAFKKKEKAVKKPRKKIAKESTKKEEQGTYSSKTLNRLSETREQRMARYAQMLADVPKDTFETPTPAAKREMKRIGLNGPAIQQMMREIIPPIKGVP